jgi:hypothetical protein
MPFETDVNETHYYLCPKWYWPFAVCTRTARVHKWCYQFAWLKATGYGFFAYMEGCENGTLYTWYVWWFGFGQDNQLPGQACFNSPRTNSGRCAI